MVAYVATAGIDVQRLVSRLMHDREELAPMVVNAVVAERAEATEFAVVDELRSRADPVGFAPTLPYSPGYCGMALTKQKKLFALFDGKDFPVTLTPDCLMWPLKSVSDLIGLGLADKIEGGGSPCDRCEITNCTMQRLGHEADAFGPPISAAVAAPWVSPSIVAENVCACLSGSPLSRRRRGGWPEDFPPGRHWDRTCSRV